MAAVSGRRVACGAWLLGAVALPVLLAASDVAEAQFVCGLSATGADPQGGQGATAPGAGAIACGVAGGAGVTAGGARSIAIGFGDFFGTSASGTGAIAIGSEAQAAGSGGLAIGDRSSAGDGAGSTAVGGGAFINPGYANSTVVGSSTIVNGSNTTSVGADVNVVGTVNNGVAVGHGATVSGDNTTAIGQGSSAGFAGSAAFGQGATTTRANQQAFGTAANTYTMAGITSGASAAAQTGPVQVVTSDASGNLATASAAALGLASTADVSAINARLDEVSGRANKALTGVAMAFAMAGVPNLLPTETFAVAVNWGTYEGANGTALNAALRITQNASINGGIAVGLNDRVAGGRLGLRFGW